MVFIMQKGGQATDKQMNTQQDPSSRLTRNLLIIIALYGVAFLGAYVSGSKILLYVMLAQIPLFFLGWGLSCLLRGRELRDVVRHLTLEEKEQLDEMSRNYGKVQGHFIGYVVVPFTLLVLISVALIGAKFSPIYVALAALYLVSIVIIVKRRGARAERKKIRQFLFSTKYAHEVGSHRKAKL
jgi:L-asparagine transporter-like permease